MVAGPGLGGTSILRNKALPIGVLLGNEDGDFPSLFDEVDYLIPFRLHQSVGADRLDSISLEWALERSGTTGSSSW